MILFHGTLQENLKSIKKNGLLASTKDQWLMEVTEKKVCCTGNHPTSGEGGNPAYFAYGNVKSRNQDGYLVVMDVPGEILYPKIIAIFDNKTLDDYVRLHFFIREEFRSIGKELFQRMTLYQEKDRYWADMDEKITKRPGKQSDTFLFTPGDQRYYYKKLRNQEERWIYNILGQDVTDEFYDFILFLGRWQAFYEFLKLHFGSLDEKKYCQFQNYASFNHSLYWKNFYEQFPLPINEPKYQSFQNWFSPQWLMQRKLSDFPDNCQILSESLGSEYLLGFIKITTPSGFAQPFRTCRAKSGFSKEVWKEVHRFLNEKGK